MRDARIRVEDLLLDGQNPRHERVSASREAIQELLKDDAAKMVALAEDIAERGLSPMDSLIIMPSDRGLFTVLEGNRRTAVLKLLANPALAVGHPTEAKFRALAPTATLPEEVKCVIARSREEAKPWLIRRHRGEQGGIGVVPWSPDQQNRFFRQPGTQTDKASLVLDALGKSYADNTDLMSGLKKVRRDRITTLGRIIGDPYVRNVTGLKLTPDGVQSHYAATDVEPLWGRILEDLAGPVSVSAVKSKAQRKKYIDELAPPLLKDAAYLSAPEPLQAASMVPGARRRRPKKARADSKKYLLDDVDLVNLGSRVAAVVDELKRIDIDTFPNAAAVLLRVVIELCVYQVHQEKGWKIALELKDQVRKCLREIDKSEKDPKWQAIRTGLQDQTSVVAVRTLHGYVHNPHFHPGGTELRTIAANWTPFLQALDELV